MRDVGTTILRAARLLTRAVPRGPSFARALWLGTLAAGVLWLWFPV